MATNAIYPTVIPLSRLLYASVSRPQPNDIIVVGGKVLNSYIIWGTYRRVSSKQSHEPSL